MSPIKENIHLTNWEIVSVNPTNKNWNWKDIFCFWTVGTQSIISFALLGSLYLLYKANIKNLIKRKKLYFAFQQSKNKIYLSNSNFYLLDLPKLFPSLLNEYFL